MSEELAASIGDVLAENARLKVYLAQVTERALAAEAELALAGDGRADKQQMIAAARQVFGVALNEHEADAAAHALSGEILLRTRKLIARAG